MIEDFETTIQTVNDNVAIIHLMGDLTTLAERTVMTAYQQISQAGAKQIILNFRQDDYINTAGMAILFSMVTQAQQKDQQISIAMPTPHFQKIFEITGLSQFVTIYDNLETALENIP
jgi:anti-anti-sigma factor